MMIKVIELVEYYFIYWKLDGIYCLGDNFVVIVEIFVEIVCLIENGIFI